MSLSQSQTCEYLPNHISKIVQILFSVHFEVTTVEHFLDYTNT